MKILSLCFFLSLPSFLFAQKSQSIGLGGNYNYISAGFKNYFGGNINFQLGITKHLYFQSGINYNEYHFNIYEGSYYGGKYSVFKNVHLNQIEIPLSLGLNRIASGNEWLDMNLGFSIIPNLRFANPTILTAPGADTLINPTLNFQGSLDIGISFKISYYDSINFSTSYVQFPFFTYYEGLFFGGFKFGIGYSHKLIFNKSSNSEEKF